jgi:methylaspartate mutase epsilon subunit
MRLAARWTAIDEAAVAEEAEEIEEQVIELVDPLLAESRPLGSISRAFAEGRLDVPFAASRFARSAVVPCRDAEGAIRFADYGGLPFSATVRRRNDARLRGKTTGLSLVDRLTKDIFYFAGEACPLHRITWWQCCHPDTSRTPAAQRSVPH